MNDFANLGYYELTYEVLDDNDELVSFFKILLDI